MYYIAIGVNLADIYKSMYFTISAVEIGLKICYVTVETLIETELKVNNF